jgi:hypothetical protein
MCHQVLAGNYQQFTDNTGLCGRQTIRFATSRSESVGFARGSSKVSEIWLYKRSTYVIAISSMININRNLQSEDTLKGLRCKRRNICKQNLLNSTLLMPPIYSEFTTKSLRSESRGAGKLVIDLMDDCNQL